jgi:hypothetical protein
MITLAPISGNIQNTLNEKISMLKKGEGKTEGGVFVPNFEIGSPVTDGNRLPKNYMMTRVPFFRMTSFTPKKETSNVPVIIMGGELSPLGRLRSGFADREAPVNVEISSDGKLNYHGLYHQYGDIPYRPIAGVKDISVEFRGGGMRLGATRTSTITWTCWTWEDLSNLTPHFLQHGKTVLLEWGWTGDGALKDVRLFPLFNPDVMTFDMNKITNLNQNILLHTEQQNGHYDAMLGLVQKFDWSVNDSGGFDCNTEIISPGVTLLQKHHKKFVANQLGSLPVLSTQTQNKIERWWWWDTDAEYKFADKGRNIAKLAPYITFREYMQDFPNQVKSFIESKVDISNFDNSDHEKWSWSIAKNNAISSEDGDDPRIADLINNGIGDKIVASIQVTGWFKYEVKTKGEAASDSNAIPISTNSDFLDANAKKYWNENVMVRQGDNLTKVMGNLTMGNNIYVTWGWFEDNVLSRFFGNVDEQGKLIGEFRSIENTVGDDGSRIRYATRKDETTQYYSHWGKPVMQSTRMTNSKYLITVDAAKWLIPNKGCPVIQNTSFYFGGKWILLNALAANTSGQVETLRQAKVSEGMLLGSEDEVKKYLLDINRATGEYMPMRNILFNAMYLSVKLEETADLLSGVMSIWNEFSSIYGGVYRFKLDYDDDSNRMLLREEGYTNYKVKDLLESKKEKDSGEAPVSGLSKLFEFPIMEAGSIVKSQNITAKLPDRMQLAAMYGVSDNQEKEDEKSASTYDTIAAAAWGRINQKPRKAGTQDAEEQKRYRDLLSGAIDYPSRGNRAFGNTTANEQDEIFAELLSAEGTPAQSTSSGVDGTIQIYDSILDEIEKQQKEELIRRQIRASNNEGGPPNTETDGTSLEARMQALQAHFRTVNSIGNNSVEDWAQLYNWNSLGIKRRGIHATETKWGTWGHPKIKSEALSAMNKLLRGGDDSVLDHIDPLIPVDFEMEIDGTGGMFPGNSFHSSYVSKRYQEESLFQMVGVSHKIDNNGWSTTIKGQVRAVASQDRSQNLTSGGNVSPDPLQNLDKNDSTSIKEFQRATGLVVDGQIGPKTEKKIKDLTDLARNTAIVEHNAFPRAQDKKEGSGNESAAKTTPILVEIHRVQRGIGILLTASDAGEYHPGVKQNVKVFGAKVRNVLMGNTLVNVASEHGVTAAELKEWNPELWGVWTGEREGFPIDFPGPNQLTSVIVGWK